VFVHLNVEHAPHSRVAATLCVIDDSVLALALSYDGGAHVRDGMTDETDGSENADDRAREFSKAPERNADKQKTARESGGQPHEHV